MSGFNLKNIAFCCLKIFFTFTNGVDPDEMQHYAAFHLGLHFCKSTPLQRVYSLHDENFFMIFYCHLASADFFKKNQEHYQRVKWIASRSGPTFF